MICRSLDVSLRAPIDGEKLGGVYWELGGVLLRVWRRQTNRLLASYSGLAAMMLKLSFRLILFLSIYIII